MGSRLVFNYLGENVNISISLSILDMWHLLWWLGLILRSTKSVESYPSLGYIFLIYGDTRETYDVIWRNLNFILTSKRRFAVKNYFLITSCFSRAGSAQ